MKTLIKNVTVLTENSRGDVYKNGYVLIDGDKISACGDGEYSGGADKIVDGEGGILMPGMVNCHSHISMLPFRSMGDDCADRLRLFLFPLENDAMTPELVYAAARYAVCELLLSGVTTITDMYYFEDKVAQACDEMGIRAWVGETVINQPTCDSENFRQTMANCEALLKKWQNHSRVHPMVAPHATNTVTAQQLRQSHALAQKYGAKFTLHVSEMDYEMDMFRKQGKTPVEFLQKIGVLDRDTIAAHCIHITPEDIKIFASTGAKIAHCVGANAKSGKGVAPIYEALNAGVTVGVGTDGPSSGNTLDLFTQMRMIPYFQKTKYHNRSILTADRVVNMATMGGAKVLGAENEIGSIEMGKKADLVLIETKSANMFPVYNPNSAVVYSANRFNVHSVWVDGVQLVKNHTLTSADLRREREKLARQMSSFVARAEKYKEYI